MVDLDWGYCLKVDCWYLGDGCWWRSDCFSVGGWLY